MAKFIVTIISIFRNARITCDQHPLPLLSPWLEMNHMTDLSDEILMEALTKAEHEVLQRRKMEYESWATCESY